MSKWENFFYGVVACIAILTLVGCQAAKTVFHACHDGECR